MPSLAPLIQKAPANRTLKLGIGEYKGVVWIDKPLHIIGMGRGSALWHGHSPVLVITAPGVILENILFDVTYEQKGTFIWYMPNCQPRIINCYPNPVEMKQMNGHENILQLGVFALDQPLELPVILDKNQAWDGLDNLPTGWQVRPMPQNVYGHRGFILSAPAPKQKGYLYQPVRPTPKRHDEVLYVFGRVDGVSSARHNQPLCLTINNGKRLHLGNGLEVTDKHLSYFTKTPLPTGIYGRFIRETVGKSADALWVFWLPCNPPQPVQIDGHAVLRWSRIVVQAGMTFKFGAVTGKIEEATPPSLTLPDFANVRVQQPNTDFSVAIQPNGRYAGNTWAVTSLVDWLVAPQQALPLKTLTDVSLRIQDGVLAYPNGALQARNVILFDNQQDIYSVSCNIVLNVPTHDLYVKPNPVTLDSKPLHQGAVQGAAGAIELHNIGREKLTLHLSATTPYITIPDRAKTLIIDRSQGEKIAIGFSEEANRLPQGIYDDPNAVQITGDVKGHLGVRADIQESLIPLLTFEDVMPLPKYNLAYPAPDMMVALLDVVNRGKSEVAFRIEILEGEHMVGDVQLTGILAGGAKQNITLKIAPEFLAQQTTPNRFQISLRLWGNYANSPEMLIPKQAGILEVPIVHEAPLMSVEREWVDLPATIEGKPYMAGGAVQLRNDGNMPFMATIINKVAWLSLKTPTAMKVNPNNAVDIHIETNPSVSKLAHGLYEIPDALVITGTPSIPHALTVGVRLHIQKAMPRPYITAPTVNFGIVPYGTKTKKMTFSMGNVGDVTWRANIISHNPHITAPASVAIGVGMIADIEVWLDARALPHGAYYWEKLLTIQTADEADAPYQFDIGGYVVIEKAQAKPVFMGAGVVFKPVLQGGVASDEPQKVIIKNEGTEIWAMDATQTHKPDWLLVQPADFRVGVDAEQVLELRLDPCVSGYKPAVYGGELVFSDGTHRIGLPIEMTVCVAKVTYAPPKLHVKKSRPNDTRTRTNNRLTIYNHSDAPYVLSIRNKKQDADGLEISDDVFIFSPPDTSVVIAAHDTHSITLSAKSGNEGRFKIYFVAPDGIRHEIEVIIA